MMKRYIVHMRSKAGPVEQYSGQVEVFANDAAGAKEAAVLKLKRGAFPDRSRDMWKFTDIECPEDLV